MSDPATQIHAMSRLLITGIGRLLTLEPPGLGVLERAALVCDGARVLWLGPDGTQPMSDAAEPTDWLDARGGVVLPGLVDAHTHLVFGGDRAAEYAARCAGATYEELAACGGGIQSTVTQTRAASDDTLFRDAMRRLDTFLDHGVTTVEIKSGYGLDVESELRLLRVVRRLQRAHAVNVVPTLLGAHVVPAGVDRATYLAILCDELIPAVAAEGLAVFNDVFCERSAFTLTEARRVLEVGLDHGLRPKLHAEQRSHTGATRLGVELGAASVDHLEHATDDDVACLAASSHTAAVLLPGATLFLRQPEVPPARKLLDAGVPVALSTDLNPGTCPCDDLPLMTTLACARLGMTPEEAIIGVTRSAALALGATDRGRIAVGGPADLVVLDAASEVELPYRFGRARIHAVVASGRVVRGPGRD